MSDFAKGLGCIFVSVTGYVALFGVTIAQTIFYLSNYRDDHLLLKVFAVGLCLLDMTVTMFYGYLLWFYCVCNHGNMADSLVIPRTYIAQHMIDEIIVFLVQCFYVHTIWSLMKLQSRRHSLPLILAALILVLISLACGIGTTYQSTTTTNATRFLSNATVPSLIQLLSSAIADTYLTVSLCWILRGSGSGLPNTAGIVSQLTLYAINRGALTSVTQLLSFGTYFIELYQGSYIIDIFDIPGSALYVNSLLAVLNVRRHIRETLHVYSDFELNSSTGDSGHKPSVRNPLGATEM